MADVLPKEPRKQVEVFGNFVSYLDKVKNEVLEWKEKELENTENVQAQFTEFIKTSAGKINSLKEEESEFESVEKINQLRLEKEQKEMTLLEEKLHIAQGEENRLKPQVESICQKKDNIMQMIESENNTIEQVKKEQEYQTQQLTRGAKLYKMLGLSFERVSDDWLKLIFTQIDPAQPEREFFFVIFVDQNDKYHVEEISPTVDVRKVHSMVNELNETNDFSKFVRKMRKEFKETCVKPQ